MSADLEIFMLHHVIKHFDDTDLWSKLLTLILTFAAKGQIHE